jgi:hypothetical protein
MNYPGTMRRGSGISSTSQSSSKFYPDSLPYAFKMAWQLTCHVKLEKMYKNLIICLQFFKNIAKIDMCPVLIVVFYDRN